MRDVTETLKVVTVSGNCVQTIISLSEIQLKQLNEHFNSIIQLLQNEESISNGIHKILNMLGEDDLRLPVVHFILKESILSLLMNYQTRFFFPFLKIVNTIARYYPSFLHCIFNGSFFHYLSNSIQSASSPQTASKLYKIVIIAIENGIQNIDFIDSIYDTIIQHFQISLQNTTSGSDFYSFDSLPKNQELRIHLNLVLRILALMRLCFSLEHPEIHRLFVDCIFITTQSRCIEIMKESIV